MAYELATQRFVPTTGQTVTVENSSAPLINFLVDPAGTLASLTVVMPNSPYDGQQVSMCTKRALTSLTLNPGVAGGSFNIQPTSAIANAGVTFTWFEVIKQWVRYGQTP